MSTRGTRSSRSCPGSPNGPRPNTASGVRKMSRRHLRREIDEFAKVYNAAWSQNWGFVPY